MENDKTEKQLKNETSKIQRNGHPKDKNATSLFNSSSAVELYVKRSISFDDHMRSQESINELFVDK